MLAHPFLQKLDLNIQKKKTFLCVGLDPDLALISKEFNSNISGVRQFLLSVIERTQEHCVAYKPNLAFFEALGIEGLRLLQEVTQAIPEEIPVILDAKRSDIGNTSAKQAEFLFNHFRADATTLHPYMGSDSLIPFFERTDKYHFVLALTSNPGAQDFEPAIYPKIIEKCRQWNQEYKNVGLVVGATQDDLPKVRMMAPELLFLIPGVGAQGGDYQKVALAGQNNQGLALINMSRQVLYGDWETKLTLNPSLA